VSSAVKSLLERKDVLERFKELLSKIAVPVFQIYGDYSELKNKKFIIS